ncbi:MAG: helix-turn-helix domain-containing protein [Ruminococcaceae bacterium]|nr:helix-turn-helix domain-containing protein [Oscillospiraceae bacterium]
MSASDKKTWVNRLAVEGVNFKGYGTVPKYAMRDRELTITAKGIYAYFCAMSGSGNSTFPSLTTIRDHLKLGNRAYYTHRQYLIDQGYLSISPQERRGGEFSINLYTIVSNPKKFSDSVPQNEWQSEVYGTIVQDGIKSAGYGDIPKSVMQDDRMDIKAKAVYAYFASYAGSGKTAFPGVPQIIADLGISKTTYQKAMRTLQQLGYIVVTQKNGSGNGKEKRNGFGVNSYHLMNRPILAQPKNAQTVDAQARNAQTTDAQPVFTQTVGAQPKNAQTTNNTFSSKNTKLSKIHPKSITTAPDALAVDDGWDAEENEFELLLKENLDYDRQSARYPDTTRGRMEELILLMVSACEGEGKTVRIGGASLNKRRVRERFLSLTADHLLYVIECVDRKRGEIRNVRAYYLAALYHAPETMESYYDRRVREDMEGPGGGADSL